MASGNFDPAPPAYSSDSDSDSDSSNEPLHATLTSDEKITTPETRFLIPAPYRRPDHDELPSSSDLLAEHSKLRSEMEKLTRQLNFYQSELAKSQKTLAEMYDPDMLKRRRSTFQYACRGCGNFPKKTNCTCIRSSRTQKVKRLKKNEN
jgi:hypothetical protein